jgi:hypothetical protein
MIKNASATKREKAGELCKNFVLHYNSKTHGGLDIQLHQLFDNVGMEDITFAEGVPTNIGAENLTRGHKSAPGPFSQFSFSEMKAISGKNDKDRSLLIEICSSTKGGLMKNVDKIKSSAKATVTVPQDFHSFIYQLPAFAYATSFFFGEESILAVQLQEFVSNIKGKHSIIYQNQIASNYTFPAKNLWSIDGFDQLFLEDCHKCTDHEEVDQQVINFDSLNMDDIMFCVHAKLPVSFHKKRTTPKRITLPEMQMARASAREMRATRESQTTKRSITKTKFQNSRWPKAKCGRRPFKENTLKTK